MKAVVYIAAATILVNTVNAVNPKHLNLALETVLQFDKKDRIADIAVIDKVQDFLNQIKYGMHGSARRSTNKDMTFTDFILKAAKTLKNLDDNKLEDAFVVVKEESRRYVNSEKHLRELFPHTGIRRYINNQLDNVEDLSADELRRYLNSAINVIEYLKLNRKKNDVLEIANTLYTGAGAKLRAGLRNLDIIKRNNSLNLENIVRDTLDFLVYKHYIDLSPAVRSKIISAAQYYWRAFHGNDNGKKIGNFFYTLRTTPFKYDLKSKIMYTTRGFDSPKKTQNKIIPAKKEIERAPVKQDIFLTESELSKLINKKYEENIQDILSVPHITGTAKRNRNVEKEPAYVKQVNEHDKSQYVEEKKYARKRDSREFVLMGGQVTRVFGFRAKSSSSEDSVDRNGMEDSTSTEEIVIQHNNIIDVGLSRKTPGRLNITFVSAENDQNIITKNKANSDETDEYSDEKRVIRKSNINDTLEIATDKYVDVKTMIQKLEEQLEAVKDQVEYLKSLTVTQTQSKDSKNELINKTNNANSDEVVTPKTYSFRAQDDDTSEIFNQNDTDTTVADIDSANRTDLKKSNDTRESTQEETTEKAKTIKIDFDKSKTANNIEDEIDVAKNKTILTNPSEDQVSSVTKVNNSTATNVEEKKSAEEKMKTLT